MIVRSWPARALLALMSLALWLAPGPSLAADVDLPAPQTEGGMGLFEALKKRSSVPGGDFSLAEVTLGELSTVLWAASGLNRGQTGWTVPMAEGLAPYVRIYVAGQEGTFRYDWGGHRLVEVSGENIKARIGGPAFIRKAFYVLVLTTDREILGQLVRGGKDRQDEFAQVLAGAMTQDIYLAAAALSLGTRYIHSMNVEAVKSALGLGPDDYPIALMLLGK
ncbi:MAG: nitroreductase family protein [Deltaproteobacteria bacterium]|nr:nitroreductase family protein [Deltaproteobacteria bacterium]